MHIDRDRLKQQNQDSSGGINGAPYSSSSSSYDSLIDFVKSFHRLDEESSPPEIEMMEISKNPEPVREIPEEHKKIHIPGKYILLGIIILVLVAALLFKVFMSVSYKPVATVKTGDYPELNITITDNEIEVRNPNLSNPGEKAGIIIYPDLRVEGECYLPLMIALAEKGFDCFLPKAYGNQPYLNADGAKKIIRKYPGIGHWVLVGHSHSIDSAAGYAASHPNEIGGLIYLGGGSGVDLSSHTIPLISVSGSQDTISTEASREKLKKNNPADTIYTTIEGGNNGGFLNAPLLAGDSEALISRDDYIQQLADVFVFFSPGFVLR